MLKDCEESIIEQTLTAATCVHSTIGPGLLESIYEKALALELTERGLRAETQVPIPVRYRGQDLGMGFRADLIVEQSLLLELKCVETLNSLHVAQTITYLRLLGLKRGYLLNFNTRLLKHGVRRISI
ncbi:GxxExxY protein [Thiohalomonas denitrificans]|uniref:GxxExxY protein n=1 Tax=Thiohalomonas denitrificans TaxID=415747 RepID=A0A1G5Q954_9GAMM|nr:GxxExxY protein [Thiohalomonas denitrificans]SCZ57921.1 GxxExxY protein [Thiohalomonas denitrificans]